MQQFTLPTPVSTNALTRNLPGVGRVRTGAYKKWHKAAGWEIVAQKVKPMPGRVMLRYELTEKARIDLGNCEKCVTDLLVGMGIIDGDDKRTVRGIELLWSADVEGVRVTIMEAMW